jgi:hypothetical protein
MTNAQPQQNYYYINRRIGSTNYKVKVYFSDTERETMEEKILRMVKNDAMQNATECAIMNAPQMSRQSERSAS